MIFPVLLGSLYVRLLRSLVASLVTIDKENGIHVSLSFIDDITSSLFRGTGLCRATADNQGASVRRRRHRQKKRQRPLKAGVASGCMSETNANTPTFCSNRVFAMALGVPSAHRQMIDL
jgi:hypothetical protein